MSAVYYFTLVQISLKWDFLVFNMRHVKHIE